MLKHIANLMSSRRRTRLLRIALAGLCLVIAVSAVIGSLYVARNIGSNGLVTALTFVTGLAVGFFVLLTCLKLIQLLGQRSRDLNAHRIWSALRRGQPHDAFCLYLRPFASTDAIDGEIASAAPVFMGPFGGPLIHSTVSEIELEFDLVRQLRPFGPLIALGEPLEHIGAGRIKVPDTNWQEAVRRLVRSASLIVLLPSSRPGTLWEVDRLAEWGALDRTIVIDPPTPIDPETETYDQSAEWGEVRDAFARHGYALPDDTPDGLVVWFDPATREADSAPLAFGKKRVVRRFARRLLKSLGERPKQAMLPRWEEQI